MNTRFELLVLRALAIIVADVYERQTGKEFKRIRLNPSHEHIRVCANELDNEADKISDAMRG